MAEGTNRLGLRATDRLRKLITIERETAGKPSAGATGVDTMAEEKQRPSLIQRVETMTSVIELLLETLAGLSVRELEKFKTVLIQSHLYRRLYWRQLRTDMQDTVFLMVQTDGQQSVETTKQVLKKMKRTDLVQILSDSSSGTKKKHSVDEHLSALIHKVATMRAFKELLLETLSDLSNVELKKFKCLLQFTLFQRNIELISWRELHWIDSVNQLVDVILKRYGQQSVEVTKEVLMDMNRTDLVQRLPETSSGHKVVIKCVAAAGSSAEAFGVRTTEREKHCVDEHWPALIQKVETMTSVIELLLETLAGLIDRELRKFREVLLSQTNIYRHFSGIRVILWEKEDQQATVFLMVLTHGQQSVEMTKQFLKKMKRTDLVQRLSDSSKPKKQHSDEHRPALIQKVTTMAAVKQLLLETLNDLSDKELKKFKWSLEWIVSQKNLPDFSPELSDTTDRAKIVDVMLQTYSQQSVQLTREVVKKMNRTDLMQRLSKPSSELKEKHSVDDHLPAVLERAAVKQILLETLKDLSYKELKKIKWLLRFTQFQKGLPHISLSRLQWTDSADPLVDLMVQTCGQQSVEVTKEVFMDMNRTDLVNKLSVISSRIKEKHPSELLQKEVTMTPLMEKLLETLEDLRPQELGDFKRVLLHTRMKKGLPEISTQRMEMANRVGMLKLMVEIYGQQSVEVTREVLMEMERNRRGREEMNRREREEWWLEEMVEMEEMNRTDLAERLSEISSGLKKEHPSEPLQKEVTKTPLMEKLLETLEDLSPGELEKFKHVLQYTKMEKDLPKIPGHHMEMADKVKIVELMVKIYGQQSVEVTCKVLRKMNRTDLAEMLSGTSSGLKEKHQSKPLQKVVTRTSLMEKLLETLKDLSYGELEQFKHVLQHTRMKKDLPKISSQRMEMADRDEIVELMVEIYGEQSVEVTREVLMEMNRTDLAERLSEISSGSKGPSGSSELEGCGSVTQDSSDWTKLDPEVNCTDADEAPTYSLQSGAGNFECSVSGLRWVCEEKVSFKYQFCSLSGHFERIESMKYMPAGPLMDITVTAGKLDVVYLPHWICIDDNPTILDKFAVLHIDDCGDAVEKVSEVTSSHVKLSEPVFSLLMVLLDWLGLPVEINCMVLIYSKILTASSQTSLTLHVYLIPCDLGLQEELDSREKSYGFKGIRKPKPEKSLKMQNWFTLTTDQEGAQIYPKGEKPQTLKLRYDSTDPNFYEVVIKNPDKDFKLMLTPENGHQPVWTSEILQGEWQSTGHIQEKRSVDKHQEAADGKALFKMLKELTDEEFKEFKWYLLRISKSQRQNTDRVDLVDLMLQTYTQESVEVAKDILKEIGRNDLVQLLSDTSSGSEAAGSSA
ncbi:uncharacterized protein LOC125893024 isoform X2 [Epinephelus fuscoguttatus]|uniref:uncharacterized protein LOC125893024 isoform X2 n=1 Tax=Epinephelus fuscoguttatus TaxID=293821 RepID=UPI0020D1CD81|nr:uncharacterized protein LOC125893024 isoform X2 [Epinephelus fuscoguttatus]